MIAHTAGQHGYNLTITRYLGSEKYHRYEYEQWAEHIHIIRNKIQVIVKYDLIDRSLILKKIIQFLCQVKHYGNTHNQHNRKEECAKELANDIFVESFQN